MPDESQSLRARVEAFRLDEAGAIFPFSARLTREQGWTHAFTTRVLREYKRFLVLAMEAGHPVTPSETVDQAWHLHLVYTRSYWQHLCRDTLGRELHHEPTSGGREEGEKFTDWYARTLESYHRLFGEAPPRDIWPRPDERFGAAPGRWVYPDAWWLIPRPAWLKRGVLSRLFPSTFRHSK